MTTGRRQRAAWWLLIGGLVSISVMFTAALKNAPWDVWSSNSSDVADAPMTRADVLLSSGWLLTVVLLVVIPFLSFAAGWVAAVVLPLPLVIATHVRVDGIIRTNPEMNLAGIEMVLACGVYVFAVMVMLTATACRWGRLTREAKTAGHRYEDLW